MLENHVYDMIVIGGGPGGYTAALYAARAGLDVVLLEKQYAGGQMTQTHQIDNYPGYPDGIDGYTLADNMRRQAERFGAQSVYTEVIGTDLKAEPKTVRTVSGEYRGRTVVIASGADPRRLGIDGEEELVGRGVAYCAACDGMFYRGKNVVVVGGGNTAAGDALLLSRVASHVTVIHRRDTLRAEKVYHEPLMAAENVTFAWNSTVDAILHEDRVTGVRIRNTVSGEIHSIPCDGVFVSIGRKPASAFLGGQAELDESGYIIADETTETSIPGVYAVGDVRTKALRQIVTAVADGAMAVHAAQDYLAGKPEDR